ncbi:MAG: hypothetical protein R2814_03690 [Flavobacteriaceae bacterium]
MKKSKTMISIRKANKVSGNVFDGHNSHFKIDYNTMEEVLRSFHNWKQNGSDKDLLENLKALEV